MWSECLVLLRELAGRHGELQPRAGTDRAAPSLGGEDGGRKAHLLGRRWSWGRTLGAGAVFLRWTRRGGREEAAEVGPGSIR